MSDAAEWKARIEISLPSSAKAARMARALGPEAEREVPRAHSSIRRLPGKSVTIRINARDTGALRAALNTYLGWVKLISTTENVLPNAKREHKGSPKPKRLS